MKIKVNIFNKRLFKSYAVCFAAITTILSLILSVFALPEFSCRMNIFGLSIGIALLSCVFVWVKANLKKEIKLTINNSKVIVKIGNIFETDGLKVIGCNEYFDTIADDKIIAKKSIHGQFLGKLTEDAIKKLDEEISNNNRLKNIGKNENRIEGKKSRYKLGSIHKYGVYFLTAFTKFDDDNRAILTVEDYISCLLNFWNEIDICYACETVNIPLMGAGITRFYINQEQSYINITEQENLELLIRTFKLTQKKLASLNIIIHESIQDKINFYKLKDLV